MKKYSEVLNEKRTPLTGEAISEATRAELEAEVMHLREMMAIAYHWIGRPAPKNGGLTRAYMGCLREAQRIHGENKEMKQ